MARIPAAVAAYYRDAPQPQRGTLLAMRERILEVIPEATEVMKYAMPTFIVDGKPVCGLMAHTKHVGFYPYTGGVLPLFPEIMGRYGGTASALHVPIDKPLPKATVRRLIRAKLAQT